MRFSESWLREWVDPDVGTDVLSHRLSMAGLEVESVEQAAPPFSGVVVGNVISVDSHPDADKLNVTQVDVGADEALQIVCGASNVAVGMRVPVATVGAILPGDFRITKAKLRGVQSSGMICSASELGLADSSEGIMPLPADAPVGEDFRHYLDLDDSCIEVDLTPDRGDCLSLMGVARDVSAIFGCDLNETAAVEVSASTDEKVAVLLQAPQACPRYLCRIVSGIDPAAETPLWMQERLRRGGLRSLGVVVDVTNYVLLELGQPMHGFDLDRLSGGITVRMAQEGEKLALLDGGEVTLKEQTLVIADDEQPLAMAGIMGGAASGVVSSTTDVLLESAYFDPLAISGKARLYGLHTDSSHRFERGVDPALQRRAMERATALLLEIAGGSAGEIVEAAAEGFGVDRKVIHLRRSRIERLLGVVIDDETVTSCLQRLGMSLSAGSDGWLVTPPSWRFDVAIEADLIEEVGRIYGYDNIPQTHGHLSLTMHLPPEAGFSLERALDLLSAREYQEVITYSFISAEAAARLQPHGEQITLANPISADMSVMRPSLWGGLLETARHNQARQQDRIRLLETGLRFSLQDDEIIQEKCLSGLLLGTRCAEQWGQTTETADFFDLKGDVESLLSLSGCEDAFNFVAAEHPVLHPGQSARIERDGATAGWLGLLHPELEKFFGIKGKAYLFEIVLSELESGSIPAFRPLSKFPRIRRDFAIVVDSGVSYAQVEEVIRSSSPEIIREIALFDVYTGENVESNRKSLALSLILQDKSRTLDDDEVQKASQQVLTALETTLGATLRE
ncbi:MAG: phenylalanine--tRNA ligase subunit beta [Pseudomonadota bacterium]